MRGTDESGRLSLSYPKIIKEFRWVFGGRNQRVVPGSSTGDVEQVPLGVVDLFQVGLVDDGLDTGLRGDNLIVTGHYGDRPELQPFRKVHCADGDVTECGLDIIVEDLEH